MREYVRLQNEAASNWKRYPLLAGRFLLLNMIGKGGFSEVYRAFDVVELKGVACKIHELSPQWSDEKKANYMRCEVLAAPPLTRAGTRHESAPSSGTWTTRAS